MVGSVVGCCVYLKVFCLVFVREGKTHNIGKKGKIDMSSVFLFVGGVKILWTNLMLTCLCMWMLCLNMCIKIKEVTIGDWLYSWHKFDQESVTGQLDTYIYFYMHLKA